MATWQWLLQKQSGSHFFTGKLININCSVIDDIQLPEILLLLDVVRKFAERLNGLNAVQVFVNSQDSSKKLYLVDNLSKEMIESGKFKEVENICSVMWDYEFKLTSEG